MKQIKWWLGSCLLAVVMLLTGCGSQTQNTLSQPKNASSAQTEESQMETSALGETSSVLTEAQSTELSSSQAETSQTSQPTTNREENTAMKMNVQVGNSTFTATLEQNAAVDTLVQMMENAPVTIRMSDYAGFEKVGALGRSLPTSNSQTTTHPGDIVLYQGNQIVIFYGTNSWSYTRIGRIDDLTGWEDALGNGNVTVTFSISQ